MIILLVIFRTIKKVMITLQVLYVANSAFIKFCVHKRRRFRNVMEAGSVRFADK